MDQPIKGQLPVWHDVVVQQHRALIGGARAEGEQSVGCGIADLQRDRVRAAIAADEVQHVAIAKIGNHILAKAEIAHAVVVIVQPDLKAVKTGATNQKVLVLQRLQLRMMMQMEMKQRLL